MLTTFPRCLGILLACISFCSAHAATVSLVSHGEVWRWHKGTSAPPANWLMVSDDSLDATWNAGAGGFGYADQGGQETNNCGTIVADMKNRYTTAYLRKQFTVTNTLAGPERLYLRMDWDDGFIAWLDGRYLTNRNVAGAPVEPSFTNRASASHESSLGSSGQPAQVYDLGFATNWITPGTHTLAIIGLNQTIDSGDFIVVPDLYLDIPAPPLAINTNTTWRVGDSPYTITSQLVVASNATLTIEPGVTVRFQQGIGMTVHGQLLADGTESLPITFTRNPGDTSWSRLVFTKAGSSRLRHCIIEYANSAGDHQDYYDTDCNPSTPPSARTYHEAVVVLASQVDFEFCVFRNLLGGAGNNEGDALAIISDDPQVPGTASARIYSCRFDGIGQGVHTRFSYVLIEGCYFINKHGDNDDVDLYGESTPPPLVLNNMFAAPCHEDRINPTRCSALIIGNVVAVSDDHGIVLRDRGSPVLVNNLVYNCANGGISVQNTCDALIANNTIVNCGRAFRFFDHFDRHGPPYCLTPGSGRATIVNCIVWDCPQSMLLTDSPDGHSYANVSYCDIEGGQAVASVSANSTLVWGEGNLNMDPMFASLSARDLRLLPGSPCIDVGTNLSALVTNDFDGLARPLDGNGTNGPSFDIGAHEYLLAGADSNSDGIPDGWTRQYGFSPLDPTVATANPDGDSQTTYEEWITDTNPTNALSWFRIEGISNKLPAAVSLTTSSNRLYTLFYATNIVSGPWMGVPGQIDVSGRGASHTLTHTNAPRSTFYRVGVRVP